MESAREAVELSTEALSWAPPHSRIRHWLVARMLLTRARAQIELGQLNSAATDLEAAVVWAKQDSATPQILFAEIHLARATALLRLKKPAEAQAEVDAARLHAQALAADGAALLCDALLLEGDIAVRLGDPELPRPEHYFREVFAVAARFNYPNDTWIHLDRALSRLEIADEAARAALMGPVQQKRADLEAALEEKTKRVSFRGRQEAPGFASIASGSVPGAAETISALHQGGFRHCYRQALSENPEASGSIRLTIAIGSEGQVESVNETHHGLDPSVVACVLDVARGAVFERPESTKAVVVVPVSFVRQ